jgi:hypothetical protein
MAGSGRFNDDVDDFRGPRHHHHMGRWQFERPNCACAFRHVSMEVGRDGVVLLADDEP